MTHVDVGVYDMEYVCHGQAKRYRFRVESVPFAHGGGGVAHIINADGHYHGDFDDDDAQRAIPRLHKLLLAFHGGESPDLPYDLVREDPALT
ncbi:hypothetical protein Ais01nite_19380 [Asanoa ishikariensis]|uniref:Uncharacterized protein n=2 Tax=Asanoa ishikariensis TaxID=137265 RepID=A0A1H3UDR4_9ACTN|nr:hypothetical protein Ais01nite_19380 [Asanoa ishikariensis]SDZ59789.1 hypothetical protein SAMN05421684_6936 [Asanoa ishikariensis]